MGGPAASTLLPSLVFLSLSSLFLLGLGLGLGGGKCTTKGPTVQQTQVGFGDPPKYEVQVQNNCPMCPVINVHVRCGRFNQSLVSPSMLKVVGHDDCVVNGGLPLPPLQKIVFTYSHHMYEFEPSSWSFQCE